MKEKRLQKIADRNPERADRIMDRLGYTNSLNSSDSSLRRLSFKKNSVDIGKAFASGGLTGTNPYPKPKSQAKKSKPWNTKGYNWGSGVGP